MRHGIEVAWLTAGGRRCHGQLVGTHADKTALRIVQHQVLADQHHKRELARMEGGATAVWYSLFGNLLKAPWTFTQRVRRPPTDPVNALLSLGYTWLLSRTGTRCEALGPEVALGALHEFRHGRPSLACDLIEPLRVPAVDRWVIALCNEGRITVSDFLASEPSGIRLHQEIFPRVLADWEKHWMSSGIEALLHQSVERFIQRIRWFADNLPSLDGMAVDREGLGNGATPDQTGD